MKKNTIYCLAIILCGLTTSVFADIVYKAGHDSLQHWQLPDPEAPKDNPMSDARLNWVKSSSSTQD